MAFTGIEVDSNGTPVVFVDTVDGSPLVSHAAHNGRLPIALGDWGVTAGGTAYFDPGGVTPGELAVVGWDVNARGGPALFLESATDPAMEVA